MRGSVTSLSYAEPPNLYIFFVIENIVRKCKSKQVRKAKTRADDSSTSHRTHRQILYVGSHGVQLEFALAVSVLSVGLRLGSRLTGRFPQASPPEPTEISTSDFSAHGDSGTERKMLEDFSLLGCCPHSPTTAIKLIQLSRNMHKCSSLYGASLKEWLSFLRSHHSFRS